MHTLRSAQADRPVFLHWYAQTARSRPGWATPLFDFDDTAARVTTTTTTTTHNATNAGAAGRRAHECRCRFFVGISVQQAFSPIVIYRHASRAQGRHAWSEATKATEDKRARQPHE